MGHLQRLLRHLMVCLLIHYVISSPSNPNTTHSTPSSMTSSPHTTHSTPSSTTLSPNTTHSTPSSTTSSPNTTQTSPSSTTSSPHTTHSTPSSTTSSPNNAHSSPSSTTSSPNTTQTSPSSTTSSPHTTHSTPSSTTSSPHTTHSTPSSTTSSPHTTHSTPSSTTSSPKSTHSTPSSTTSSPNTTHSTPSSTTSSPHTTHSTLSSTTSSPNTTHSTPSSTTSSPHTTHSTPSSTTSSPNTTHSTPSSTTSSPNTTHSTPSSTTSSPHTTHSTPSSTTSSPNTTQTSPSSTTSSPHTTHSTPSSTTSSPNNAHSSPSSTTSSPNTTQTSPSSTTSSPHTTHSTPSSTTSSPHTTHSTPSSTTSSPHTTHSTPSSTTSSPKSTHSTPSSTTSSPNTTHSTLSSTTSSPNSTHSTPSSTTLSPNTTHSTPSSTTLSPNTTHSTPSSTTLSPNTTHSTLSSKPSSPKASSSKHETSPVSEPTATTPPSSPVSGKVTIMEVYYNLPQGHDHDDMPEFLELYGDSDLYLQGYTIVLFAGDEMEAYLIISLDGYRLPHTNAAFVIATFNASFGPDIILTNKSLTGPSGEITMVALYKNHSSSFTLDSTPTRDGLVDYVVYSSGTSDMPSDIRDWSYGFKAVVKDSHHPYESVSRCYSDEPNNQRAFTLSLPTPGEKNACDLRDNYPIINEIGHVGKNHTCFIEMQYSNNDSQALNSFFLAIYSLATTAGHPIQNVTFDLWNERIDESGYYLLNGTSNGSLNLDCEKTFVGGTIVVVLYQVPSDLRYFNKKFSADDTYQYLIDGVAFNISQPLETSLAKIVLPEKQEFPRLSLHDGGSLFLSGEQTLSSCGRFIYNLTDPTPGGPNDCPLRPSILPTVTMSTSHHTVKPNHVYINEVTYSVKNSEEYIEFKGDTHGDFSHYYIILFNTCTGEKIGGVPLNHALDQKGFLQFNHTSTHTFLETLKHTGSIALGLYTHNVTSINVTQGLLDAIVMQTTTNGNCSFLSFSLNYLTPNVLKPIFLSKSDLDDGMTLSRCSGNLRNSSSFKVTKLLTESTPGTENICDTPIPHVLPVQDDKNPNAVMITIAVVASCLVVFLIIFGGLVVIMKRKRRGVLQFRLAIMKDDDDDELIRNLDVEQEDLICFDNNEDATFDNKVY